MTLQAPLIKGEKKQETCGEQLRRMCKNIADGISSPEMITDEETGEKREQSAGDWMEGTYDIRYYVDRDKVTWARRS
jgi:hypothetical protein